MTAASDNETTDEIIELPVHGIKTDLVAELRNWYPDDMADPDLMERAAAEIETLRAQLDFLDKHTNGLEVENKELRQQVAEQSPWLRAAVADKVKAEHRADRLAAALRKVDSLCTDGQTSRTRRIKAVIANAQEGGE